MRRRALLEAIKQKLQSGNVVVVEDIELAEPKTKLMAQVLSPLRESAKTSLLLVPHQNLPDLYRAARNIPALDLLPQPDLNAYAVWRRHKLVLLKSACKPLIERYK
jgi:large subunit ribosomal protein L4